MNKNLNATKYIYRQFKHFYRNQKGVYAVITALLAFPLLFLIAFTVDGTGMLLDKARFAQATDQAALLLVAENNAYRKGADHNDLTRQSVSQDELDAYKREFSSDKNPTRSLQTKKRNQELVQGIVKLYLRSDDSNGQRNSAPITIPKDFIAECRSSSKARTNGEASTVACQVDGYVERKFFLHWSHTLTSNNQDKTTISSGKSYAVKEKDVVVPIDLMLVNDFSTSMEKPPAGQNTTKPKIDILKSVVGNIADELIKKDLPENISKYNRIGFVSFGLGAQQLGNDYGKCVLPFDGNTGARVKLRVGYWKYDDKGKAHVSNAYGILKNKFSLKNSDYVTEFDPNKNNDGYMYIEDNSVKLSSAFLGEWIDNTIAYVDTNPENPIQKAFYGYFDIKKTLSRIDGFDGSPKNYDIVFTKGSPCLKDTETGSVQNTTKIWFNGGESEKLKEEMNALNPEGWTLSSSGTLIGANLLMSKNTASEAAPAKLRTNTQRILIVLSDGEDTGLHHLTEELIAGGMCTKIKSRLDTLQDPGYRNLPAKMAFVAFGYKQSDNVKKSWKSCVGDENYYQADNEEALLKTFKQIIGLEEEVGRSSTFAPDLFK